MNEDNADAVAVYDVIANLARPRPDLSVFVEPCWKGAYTLRIVLSSKSRGGPPRPSDAHAYEEVALKLTPANVEVTVEHALGSLRLVRYAVGKKMSVWHVPQIEVRDDEAMLPLLCGLAVAPERGREFIGVPNERAALDFFPHRLCRLCGEVLDVIACSLEVLATPDEVVVG